MAGMAYQCAPQQGKAAAPKEQAKKPEQEGSLKERLHRLPQAAGIALLVLLLALSVPVGNYRTLKNASPRDFAANREVVSIIEDRIDAAENILSVAGRCALSAADIDAARQAAQQLGEAKTARDISRADQQLMKAVSSLTTAELAGEDARSMTAAADDFAELGSFLRQQARAYNEKAEKAMALYEKLPAKALLREPDLYEGV